ncbi:MAG: hypothetical protein OXP70_04830 [Acidobacteriota bacterium]|nr:hypothetical protein [Acidobacteriota bacterium]
MSEGRPRRVGAAFLCALALATVHAGAMRSGGEPVPALVIVAGVGGSPEHRERFSGWARDLCAAALRTPAPSRVRVLVERLPDGGEPDEPCAPVARSTQEDLAREIETARGTGGPEGGLVLVLIGHGSAGGSPRFQLPGPDLSPERLGEMLNGFGSGPVTVAHLGSAAGAFVPALAGPGRVVLAATRAGETNETRFPRHFIAALAGDEGDRNKDGRVSALEAFDFARRGVEREYEQEGLLRTEHALLDDNGDGVGSLEPEMASGMDGVLAGRRTLLVRTLEAVADTSADTPEIRRLVAERDGLASRVDALREAREGMEEETYLAELETLLLQIAELAERIAALREKTE